MAVDKDPDERVSLAPLDPETALRGLLATPPADEPADDDRDHDDDSHDPDGS